jgi:uncharacterized protein involved in exopolysaccharide biosynthesis
MALDRETAPDARALSFWNKTTMLPGRKYTPDDIVRILRRRWWMIALPGFLGMFAGLFAARSQPEVFTSETQVQVLPQRVPKEYVNTTVTSTVEERLKIITDVLKSRTQVERLIEEFDLFPQLRGSAPLEDIIGRVRSNIAVDVAPPLPGVRRLPNMPVTAFKVSFSYEDRAVALKVAQRLTDLLMAENSRMRGNLAEKTSEFMEAQLDDARRKLEEQEGKLEAFRIRHSGRLPSQQTTNLQVYQTTQLQLNQLLETIARDEDRKAMLERIYNEAVRDPASVAPAPPVGQTGVDSQALPTGGSPERRLAAARAMLANLELRLKPDHPDVRRKKREITDLEREVAASPTPAGDTATQAAPLPQDEVRRDRLRQQRAEIESLGRQIAFKQREADRVRREISDYRARLESVPTLESEEAALTRDLTNLQDAYKALKTKSEDSKVAANLEIQQIGEQFRVLDLPRLSPKAEAGGRLRANMMGIGLGVLLGLALVGFLEFRDTSFRTEADIINALSLPVVALVPYAPTAADHARARRDRILFAGGAAVIVIAGGVVFWYMQLWKFIA